MTHSILFEFFKDIDRPISQKELSTLHRKNLKQLKLSNIETYHTNTKHFYLLKRNGRKETQAKEIIESKNLTSLSIRNIGYCSVTWKLENTTNELHDIAKNIISEYERVFNNKSLSSTDRILTYYEVELSRIFYIWLYFETYDKPDEFPQLLKTSGNDQQQSQSQDQ